MSWTLAYDSYEPDGEGVREALCALGNGLFVTRGAFLCAEDDGTHYPGTYLAGGYDRAVSEVAGRRIENEDLVNIPNWLPLTFRAADGPWMSVDAAEILAFEQQLDLKKGLLIRRMSLRDEAGRTTRLEECRFVSMRDKHLAAVRLTITPEDWSGDLGIRSAVDGNVINTGVARYRDLEGAHLDILGAGTDEDEPVAWVSARMRQASLDLAVAARTRVVSENTELEPVVADRIEEELVAGFELRFAAHEGKSVSVEKVAAIYTGRDHAVSEPEIDAREALAWAPDFETLRARHALAWEQLWSRCDIEIANAAEGPQLKLRTHIFHLLQTASPNSIDRDIGVPARGWHGEAYRGHIFWDELFIFPYLNLRLPLLARSLLLYRYRRLDQARRAAIEAGYRGAMFPWQSGSTGREETQHLHLNPESGRWLPDPTHRQRHVGIAVAYNVWSYFEATGDREFLADYGAEVLLEIARFWASIASYDAARDRYDIRGVMGPDEYHTAYPGADAETAGGIDNNAYTNIMAAWVLARAFDVLDILSHRRCRELRARLGLEDAELERWEDVSRKLTVPFLDGGIIAQFEGYDRLADFDWEGYRQKYGDIQRLDRILEAEGDDPNRYKLSKQADVLMLFYLLSTEELALIFEQLGYPFAPETIPKTVEHYLARTSHGSTLSWMVHAWVLARSDRAASWHLFLSALDADVGDIQGGTTKEGIHLGAMAGTIDLAQRCYTGLEPRARVLHFNPTLPDDLTAISYGLRYRGQHLAVNVDHIYLIVESRPAPADPITIAYRGHYRVVRPGESYRFRLLKPGERARIDRQARD